jgi:SAM-dependent methyltransferase
VTGYDAFNEYERAMWSSPRADAYAEGIARLTAHAGPLLLDAVGARAGTHLLDVGTGPGVVARHAADRGCVVTGVDVSPNMVAIARANVPGGTFVEGSAEALPCDDADFDAVVGSFVVLHLGHPDRLAAETARVLRPGGRAAFTVWAVAERNRVLGIFHETLARAQVTAPSDIPDGPLSVLFAEHDRFTELLTGGGLVDVVVEEHESTFTVDPGAWWDVTVASTPRTGALVSRQSPEVQAQLRATYDEIVAELVGPDGLATFPVAVVLASATRPG